MLVATNKVERKHDFQIFNFLAAAVSSDPNNKLLSSIIMENNLNLKKKTHH